MNTAGTVGPEGTVGVVALWVLRVLWGSSRY